MKRNHGSTLRAVLLSLLLAVVPAGPGLALEQYENDLAGWLAAVPDAGAEVTIDFDEITGTVSGTEYSGMPGSPLFSLIEGDALSFDSTDQATASSGTNFLSPDHTFSEGIVRVLFDEPVFAMGAWFFDVEADFALTGFATGIGAATPDVAFSGPQGQSAQSFLGFVSDTPLDAVDIFFATGEDIDGTVLDDLRYVVVPEPTTVVLMGLGLLGLGLGGRRRART